MNREVKFRVWDKDKKIMLDPSIFTIDWLNNNFITYNGNNFYFHDIHSAQQFTGLKDKNGKEIYEGDIVNFTIPGITHGPEPEFEKNQEVKWDNEYGMWVFGKNDFSMLDRIDKKTLEIVGNIFETLELLK